MFRHRCEQKRLRLVVEPPASGPRQVSGDEGKLRQVLINLLGNAVKFTDSGEVRFRVARGSGEAVSFEVADTGIGFSAEEKAEIFQPFQQGHSGAGKGGTGLGLAISDRYIQLMGGRLEAEASPGRGARVFFTLDLTEGNAECRGPGRCGDCTMRIPCTRKISALVVDDVKENRAVLAGMLADIGCEVLVAANAMDAVEMAVRERPDIIFMDIWMPEMNGIDAARNILRQMPEARIVAHSASAFDHEQHRYLEAGFDDFFAKPFRYERICECVSKLLDVTLESEPADDDALGPPPGGVNLPERLAARIRGAAEIHNVTELRACIDEAAQLENGAPWAACLGRWVARYEMEKIIAALPPAAAIHAS